MNTKTINTNLPAIAREGGLSGYLTRIKKFPMLEAEEEYMLAKNWRDIGDLKSAQKLVTSHLRLVAKIAMGYRGYGLPVSELVSEGNIGLMQAVKKFDPEKGFKLATYAMWWIKASIQEYILRSWSLVKIGTTTAQKKLFFNLKKLKNKLSADTIGDLHPKHVDEISKRLNVKKEEVIPSGLHDQIKVKPIYKKMDGWLKNTAGIKKWEELPENARKYISFIKDYCGVKISSISTSPSREDSILIEDPFKH